MTDLGFYLSVWTVASIPAGIAIGKGIAWSKRRHG